jgi:hypothetical protein
VARPRINLGTGNGAMLNLIRSDESFQVMAFIVLPFVLLFTGGIIFYFRRIPPSVAAFPNFTLRVSRVGHEDAYIVYRDNDRRLEFYAGPADRKQSLCLELPRELSDQVINELVPNLVKGLANLRFQKYKILREGQTKILAASP